VIEALRKLGPVQVSSLDGIEETLEFSLPSELRNVTKSSAPVAAAIPAE
jgi:4-hydroxy-3-methylbut-2-enyl diphosphate reductase